MRSLGFVLLALAAGSCTLGTGSFAGKTCRTNVECPDPYVCAQVRPEGRTCELVRGVETFDPSADNPADYCHDAKTILDKHCVSNCHGTDMSYPGSPRNFRLDVYSTGTALPGAGGKVANIKARIDADTMPPPGLDGYSRPNAMEKGIITRWANSGGPDCLGDGGTAGDAGAGDGGSTSDGGMTADAGRTDAGDGG